MHPFDREFIRKERVTNSTDFDLVLASELFRLCVGSFLEVDGERLLDTLLNVVAEKYVGKERSDDNYCKRSPAYV